jgi:SpoVK/Ycf46/Vps4 family AAA+-type ATPase
VKDTQCPLILGVFGPPGEGKTFQIDEICNSLGINQVIISPGELDSPSQSSGKAGDDPVAFLRKKYIEAGTAKGSTGSDSYMNKFHSCVLVINDVDTVLGDWGPKVEYTAHRQLLYGELMSLCDFPTLVVRQTVKRTPIILTGNNAAILYSPILRPGRMRLFTWLPDVTDRLQIISRIFSNIPVSELENLVKQYPDKTTAFWSDIKSRYQEKLLLDWLSGRSREDVKKDLEFRKEYVMDEIIDNTHVPLEEIKDIAAEFAAHDVSKDVYV